MTLQKDEKTQSAEPPPNANAFPGASSNTAGGKIPDTDLWDAAKSIKVSDLKEIHKKPCVRDSFLVGIGTGFGVGGIRAIMGGTTNALPRHYRMLTIAAPMLKACNWAVGTFCFGSFLMHEFCQRRRKLERQQMKRVVEIVEQKKAEKQTQGRHDLHAEADKVSAR